MDLCSQGHEEVCYDGRGCPACAVLDSLADALKDNEKLEEKISELESDLETERASMEANSP